MFLFYFGLVCFTSIVESMILILFVFDMNKGMEEKEIGNK